MLIAYGNVFSFISSTKEIPAYSKQLLCDVLAIVKQLGIATYFFKLLGAALRWRELPYTINKLTNLGISDEEFENLS